MARRISELEQADYALQDWAAWCIQNMEQSPIGYARRTADARLREGTAGVLLSGFFSSREPNVMMPPYIATIDRAVRDASGALQAVAVVEYLITGADVQPLARRKAGKPPKKVTDDDRARVLGLSRAEFRWRRDILKGMVFGAMSKRRKRAA